MDVRLGRRLVIVLGCIMAWHNGHVRAGVGHVDGHVELVHHLLAILLDFGPAVLEPVLPGGLVMGTRG